MVYLINWLKSFQIRSFFWSVFSRIRTEYGKIWTRKNSVFGHFLCSLINLKLCKDQYAGFAYKNNFKSRFRVHKSDINTGKDNCGATKLFSIKCTDVGKIENTEVHLIKQVEEGSYNIEGKS